MDFFQQVKESRHRSSRTTWMAEQCFELARALGLIQSAMAHQIAHHPDVRFRQSLEPHAGISLNAILYFKSNNEERLELDIARLGSNITWDPPEAERTPNWFTFTRDVYSLGAIFLEIVTWLLEGFYPVDRTFTDARIDGDLNEDIKKDTFYSLVKDRNGVLLAERKSTVTEWTRRLKTSPQASAYTDQFLDLINERMLVPEPEERATITEVQQRLYTLKEGCRLEDAFMRPKR